MGWTVNSPLELFFQVCRFGIVGLVATFIHIGVFTGLVEAGAATPAAANVLAFIPAFLFSFYSHWAWTFRAGPGHIGWHLARPMAKFLVVALIGLGLNSLGVFMVTDYLQVEYYYSTLVFLFVTPSVLFVLNKFIVFRT